MGIMEKMRLDGKRSFVTGGARGIGKAIATALAEAGSNVALLDVDIATAQQTAAEIAQATGRVIRAYEVDVTQEAQVDAVVQQLIEDLGGLDCAFCNAGICLNVPAAEMTLAQWRKVIDINLTGVFLTARAAGRHMIRQGKGSIVNTASMSAHIVNVPQPQCSYNTSKAGVYSADQILGHRVGALWRAGEQHQPRLYRYRADAAIGKPQAAHQPVERHGPPAPLGQAGRIAGHCRLSGRRRQPLYHGQRLCD